MSAQEFEALEACDIGGGCEVAGDVQEGAAVEVRGQT